ncbi:Hypothetical protein KFL_001560210 [Klebsormidium nitens]|uniref:Uncharacterized protein n=1 Tax=Klebsormidium nitens TaxID=105231 RepID=A0A1Y1HYC4_KLENI|nr:Hypothetical protein KFL_001560210 [Klebsormidium nitens]|eukprot:GAQ83654.1 Hypothetical protein KFL_001560210 [Klebsormidium nitens]
MLRRTVGVSRFEEWLSGDVPHPVKFPYLRSFYENSEFALKTVGELLVNGSVHLCAAGETKSKVVNPLSVVNLPKGRLVLDAGYINAFSKAHPFNYLDDGLTANQDFALCLWLIVAIVRFLALLGAIFSLPKCQFWPAQTGDWLGFVVDTQAEQFRVSAAKMAKDAVKLFLERLDDSNGRRWFPRQIRIEAASDASDFRFGGSLYIAGSPPFHLAGSLIETEVQQSSTACEMVGCLRILQQAVQHHRPLLSGAALLLVGDNQGAVAAVNSFRSSAPDLNAVLQEIFKLCSEADFDVLAQWKPRVELAEHDALSLVPDASDCGLNPKVFADVISLFGRPDVDMFASDTWHVAGQFVTPRYMRGCLAVDALSTDWRTLVRQGETAWIFPPVRAIPSVLQSTRISERTRF